MLHFGSRRYLPKDQLEQGPESALERSGAGNFASAKAPSPTLFFFFFLEYIDKSTIIN